MANVVMSEVDYNKLLTDARGTVTEFGARNKGALVPYAGAPYAPG